MEASIAELAKEMKVLSQRFNDNFEQVSINFKMQSSELKLIEDRLSTKLSRMDKNMEIFNNKVKGLNVKIDQKFQQLIDNDNRKCNIIVSGIPAKADESLKDIVKTLSCKLGLESMPECRIYRYKGAEEKKQPIVIRFPNEFHKQDFFQRYKKVAKTLMLGIFKGFEDNKTRIYLQHDFIKSQYQVNKLAVKLLREKKIVSTRVIQGFVYIKISAKDEFKPFETAKDLEKAVTIIVN